MRKRILSDSTIEKICQLWSEEERKILEYQQGNIKISLEKQIRHRFGHLYLRFANLEDQLIAMAETIKDNSPLLLQIKQFEELTKKMLSNLETFKKTNASTVKGGGIAGALNLKNINTVSETLSNSKSRSLTSSRSEDLGGIEDELWRKDNEHLKNNIEINLKSIDTEKKLNEFIVDDEILENPQKLNQFFDFFNFPRQVIKGNQNLIEIKQEEETDDEEGEEEYASPNPTGIGSAMSGSKNRNYGINSSETMASSVNNRKHTTKGESWTEANAIIKLLKTRLPKLRLQYWMRLSIWFSDCLPRY